MQINVTEKATEQLVASGIGGDCFLRLGVQQGGCAGMSYSAFIDDTLTQMDAVIYEKDGLRVVAGKEFLHLIDGLEINYSDDLIQPGFILKNPNAKKSCGCGSSFSAPEEKTAGACGSGGCG